MKKSSKLSIALTAVAAVSAVAVLSLHKSNAQKEQDVDICSIAYSDIISVIVQGYKCHWDGMEPGESGLSDVYRYESEFCGACEKDIDGDSVPELLIGDDFGDGNYLLYDIFTFDFKSGLPVHLLCGGERDTFVLNSSGVIIETGSNSAEDSFTKYFQLKGAKLKETASAEDELTGLEFDHFMRYVSPACYVALEGEELLGQLTRTLEEGYEIEAQDKIVKSKEGIDIEFWSAWDGKGVVFLTNPGSAPVFSAADTSGEVIGSLVYEDGFCPESCRCLGYKSGWFKIECQGMEGYVSEEVTTWDYADRF